MIKSGQSIKSGQAIPSASSSVNQLDEAISLGYVPPAANQYVDTSSLAGLLQASSGPSPANDSAVEKIQEVIAINQAQEMAEREPSKFEQAVGFLTGIPIPNIGSFVGSQMESQLQLGGSPVMDAGDLMGVLSDGPFGRVYTGRNEFNPIAEAFKRHDMYKEQDEIVPLQEVDDGVVTCPDGYMFDESLQACRLKTELPQAVQTASRPLYEPSYESTGLLNEGPFNYGASLLYG